MLQVEVTAAQLRQLAEAHGAPSREEGHQPVAVGEVLHDAPPAPRRLAGLTLWAGFTLPAPRMCAGLNGINGLGRVEAAVPRIVRSRL